MINIGNDRTVSLAQMIAELEAALGVAAIVERLPEQPGDVPQTWASVEKAQALLGYRPSTPFAEGIARFVTWLGGDSSSGSSGASRSGQASG